MKKIKKRTFKQAKNATLFSALLKWKKKSQFEEIAISVLVKTCMVSIFFFQKRKIQFFLFPKPTDDEVGRLPPEPLDDTVEARLFALKNVKWLLFPDFCLFFF